MSKIKNIISGWEKFIFKSEVTENMAIERAEFCAICPHNKHGKLSAFINDEIQQVKGNYCDICTCPLSAKIRSINEKCPINKW